MDLNRLRKLSGLAEEDAMADKIIPKVGDHVALHNRNSVVHATITRYDPVKDIFEAKYHDGHKMAASYHLGRVSTVSFHPDPNSKYNKEGVRYFNVST